MTEKMKLFLYQRGPLAAAVLCILVSASGFALAQLLGWGLSRNIVVLLSTPLGIGVCLLVMVLIGGLRSVAGPLAGALVLIGLEEILKATTEYWKLAEGLIIIAIVLMLPNGVRQLLTLVLGPHDEKERDLAHVKTAKGRSHG